MTAVELAMERGKEEIMKVLERWGAPIDWAGYRELQQRAARQRMDYTFRMCTPSQKDQILECMKNGDKDGAFAILWEREQFWCPGT
mmetsp:Transcript_15556/g.51121  ORF Transcript_15556/g.51121 Transcript_15556/m.51121 type:complete len:86 (+) Transcript_15556:28-285(+)